MRLKSSELGIKIRTDIQGNGNRRERHWFPLLDSELSSAVVEFLSTVRFYPADELLRKQAFSARPMEGHGGEQCGHGVVRMGRHCPFRAHGNHHLRTNLAYSLRQVCHHGKEI